MDFGEVSNQEESIFNPYAGKKQNGEWVEGSISVEFLNNYFGQYSSVDEMIDATESEGLKLFFKWLKYEGKLH